MDRQAIQGKDTKYGRKNCLQNEMTAHHLPLQEMRSFSLFFIKTAFVVGVSQTSRQEQRMD